MDRTKKLRKMEMKINLEEALFIDIHLDRLPDIKDNPVYKGLEAKIKIEFKKVTGE